MAEMVKSDLELNESETGASMKHNSFEQDGECEDCKYLLSICKML